MDNWVSNSMTEPWCRDAGAALLWPRAQLGPALPRPSGKAQVAPGGLGGVTEGPGTASATPECGWAAWGQAAAAAMWFHGELPLWTEPWGHFGVQCPEPLVAKGTETGACPAPPAPGTRGGVAASGHGCTFVPSRARCPWRPHPLRH